MPGPLGALLAAMLQLTVGLLFAAWLCDWREQVTRGFLVLTGATALVIGLLAFGLAGLGRIEGIERLLQLGLVFGLAGYTLLLASPRRTPRLPVGGAGLGLGLAALAAAAISRPAGLLGPGLTALTFDASAVALGSGIGGLLLGHWYLVTPKLPARPLRLLCDLLLLSLLPLTALAAWYLATEAAAPGLAGGPGGLSGPPLWLGAGMITIFPLAVTLAARLCCVDGPGRGRSLQAATGLLYLVAAAVLAGGLAGNAVLLGA